MFSYFMVKLIIAKIMRERKQEVNEMNHVDKGKASTRFVVVGLLLGIFMAAMDNTIVATAMGSIVADLGSFCLLYTSPSPRDS